MLTFLRKIRKSLIESDSVTSDRVIRAGRKYLLYAIGEITLVVIGILIALQINNWNEHKKVRHQEALLLTEMLHNLSLDRMVIDTHLMALRSRVAKIDFLHTMLTESKMIYHDSLNSYFGSVYGVEPIRLNFANYEDLKSQGFDLIQDDSLRLRIVRFFEEARYKLSHLDKAEASANEVLKPYYLENFQDIQFKKHAQPIDAKRVINDIKYHNLVHYRNINLSTNQLEDYPWFITEMNKLRIIINRYLKRE